MEIYQLKTLLMVANEGHLTRAAERLHISQPAVSAQIKALEQELGVALFERRPGGLQTTKAAAILLPHVEHVIAAATELASQAKKLSGRIKGRLTLGTIFNPEVIRLGALTNHLILTYPLLDIDIRQRNSPNMLSALRAHELDASFFLGREVPEDMRAVPLRDITYRVIASAAWRERLCDAGWDDVARLPWIVTPRESAFCQMTVEAFRAHGLTLKNLIEVDQETAIVNLVLSGVGLSFLREEVAMAARERDGIVIWGDATACSKLHLIYLASRHNDPVVEIVRSAVESVWSSAPAR
ncbi:MAG: LysR family transcriptional regulator [Burkholderiales bacterium]|nr:LysR family transcriptional regulator [Burkholderiales bacterium]